MTLQPLKIQEEIRDLEVNISVATGMTVGIVVTLALFIFGFYNNWTATSLVLCNPAFGALYGIIGGILVIKMVHSFRDNNFQGEIIKIPKPNRYPISL